MSIVKSSVVNLYDAVTGDHHFQAKVSSDRVDLQVSTLPVHLKSTSFNLTNEGGNSITDVVEKILGIEQSVADEEAARIAAVASEASDRAAADATLQSSLDAEASTRAAAVTALQTAIATEASERSAGDVAERDARILAVANLNTLIATETSERTAADTLEANARTTADGQLQSAIDAEASTRVAADTSLQSNIDAEASTRASADATLQSNITAEATARTAAIGVEATARQSADNTLSGLITAEQTARLAEVAVERQRIDSLLEGTGVDLNQLKELIAAYSSADTSLQDQITAINTNITAIQAQLTGTDDTLNTLLANIAVSEPEPTHSFTNVDGLQTLPGGVPGYDGSNPTISEQSSLPDGEFYYRFAGTQSINMVLKSLSDAGTATSADVYQTTGPHWNDPAKFPDGPQNHV
jgi:hypothetical protein